MVKPGDEDIHDAVEQATSTFWRIPPLQQAVQADLQIIGNIFIEKISQIPPSELFAGVRKGRAFGWFKEIAKDKKLAALYQFLPNKCDSAAYSQLLYAACLDLFNQNHQKSDVSQGDELVFMWDAFYIFALYLLHETNPLEVAPPLETTSAQALTTLSMGVVNKYRPSPGIKFFRRNFRPNIRVDPQTYSKLQQLKELAHSKEGPIALDMKHILNKLWPHLDLVSYLGPMNLSGLAQRQLRLESSPSESRGESTLPQPSQESTAAYNPPAIDAETETRASLPPALLEKVKSYTEKRDCLRLPPSNGSARYEQIRQAMEPMRSVRGWEDDMLGKKVEESSESAELTRLTTQIKRKTRTITFAIDVTGNGDPNASEDAKSKSDTVADAGGSLKTDPLEAHEEIDLSFELKVPPTLPDALQQSIQDAVMQLVKRDGPSMFHPITARLEKIDDLSTLASRGVSEAASIATSLCTESGIGREALQQLLQQAANDSASATTATGVGRRAVEELLKQASSGDASVGTVSGVGRGTLENLLTQATTPKNGYGEAEGFSGDLFLFAENEQGDEESAQAPPQGDISDMSDEDELLSIAGASAVGRRALGDLILEATRASRIPRQTKRSRKDSSSQKASNETMVPKQKSNRPAKKPKPSSVAPVQRDDTDSSDEMDASDEDEIDDEDQDLVDASSAVTGQGQSALKDLLYKALG